MIRYRTLVGDPWDPTMDNWTVLPTLPENDAELENYNIVTLEEAECVSPLPLWPGPSRPRSVHQINLSSRSTTPESEPTAPPPEPCSPAPAPTPESTEATSEQPDPPTRYDDIERTQPPYDSAGTVVLDNAQRDDSKFPQESDMTDAGTMRPDSARHPVASVHGLLLPNEFLQKRLTDAISRGSELEAAIEATKMAHHAINEKRFVETKLAEALKKQNKLQHALNREQAERRNAVVVAKELKYTNTTLNVMISDLQAHCLNQAESETRPIGANGLTVTRKSTVKPIHAFGGAWVEEIWLAIGDVHPQLAIAEKLWKDHNPQAALLTLHPLLDKRQEGVAVERGQLPPLSELSMLAHLMRAAIQLAARQRETALLGAQWIVHEARAAGRVSVERRAQWLRGHALLALDRPREARACFGMCACPDLPDAQLRAMRRRADDAIANLPDGHPGRQISEDFVQFYYQWAA